MLSCQILILPRKLLYWIVSQDPVFFLFKDGSPNVWRFSNYRIFVGHVIIHSKVRQANDFSITKIVLKDVNFPSRAGGRSVYRDIKTILLNPAPRRISIFFPKTPILRSRLWDQIVQSPWPASSLYTKNAPNSQNSQNSRPVETDPNGVKSRQASLNVSWKVLFQAEGVFKGVSQNMFLMKRNGSTRSASIWGLFGRNPKDFLILIILGGAHRTSHFRVDIFYIVDFHSALALPDRDLRSEG